MKTIIFDLDGVLLDTREGTMSAAKFAMMEKGYEIPNEEELERLVGVSIYNSFADRYNIFGDELDEVVNLFRTRYKDYDLLKAVPYEGIFQLLDILKEQNYKLAVATFKREDYARKLLKHFRFDSYMEIIHGSDFENKLTKKDIILKCIDYIGDVSEEIVMIGDTSSDANAAQLADISFIGVTYGYGFKEKNELMKYRHIGVANCTQDIEEILLEKYKEQGV